MPTQVQDLKCARIRIVDRTNNLYDDAVGIRRVNNQIILDGDFVVGFAADQKIYFGPSVNNNYIIFVTADNRFEFWISGIRQFTIP